MSIYWGDSHSLVTRRIKIITAFEQIYVLRSGFVKVLTRHAERQMSRCSSTNNSHDVAFGFPRSVTRQYCKDANAYRSRCLDLAVNQIHDLPSQQLEQREHKEKN